jgi:hypothetical protein
MPRHLLYFSYSAKKMSAFSIFSPEKMLFFPLFSPLILSTVFLVSLFLPPWYGQAAAETGNLFCSDVVNCP